MDVFLPPDGRGSASRPAKRVVAGETVLAEAGSTCCLACRCGARREDRPQRFRRGMYLLPSLFTLANLFCGYACVVHAMRGDFDTAALFIGVAMVLDTLDGFIARLTNSSTAFGVQFDSLADVVSFGLAPAILAFTWGLWPLRRLGWAAGFLYVTAAAMRLARFNIQTAAVDRQALLRRACRARRPPASSPRPSISIRRAEDRGGAARACDGAGAGVPDGQHDPLPQRQGDRRRLAAVVLVLFLGAVVLALIAAQPRVALVVLAYAYLASAFIGLAYSRLRTAQPVRDEAEARVDDRPRLTPTVGSSVDTRGQHGRARVALSRSRPRSFRRSARRCGARSAARGRCPSALVEK